MSECFVVVKKTVQTARAVMSLGRLGLNSPPHPGCVWRREAVTMGIALEDGLLQELWFFRILPRMRAPPGRARWTRPRLLKLPRTQEKSWQENFRTIISSGVCAKSTDIHIS